MSISAQIEALTDDKSAIENAITAKGGTLSQNSGFDTYATDIASIPGTSDIDALINRSISGRFASNVTRVGRQAFRDCVNLTEVSLPECTYIDYESFLNCTSLKNISLPKCKDFRADAFRFCAFSEFIIYHKGSLNVQVIPSGFFWGCSKLSVLVIKPSILSTLQHTNAFYGTPFYDGGTGGIVYVPQALISSYQSATNWSSLYNNGTCIFRAIEGSEYE